jgi:hypothetical protein
LFEWLKFLNSCRGVNVLLGFTANVVIPGGVY